jgi:hypothetical protein
VPWLGRVAEGGGWNEGIVGFIKLIKKSVLELVVSMGLMVVVAI